MATVPLDAPLSSFAPKRSPVSLAERARRDALRAIARGIPNPENYAWHLQKPYCFWIMEAWKSQDPANCGCLRVAGDRARHLFPMGLCDRDGFLTVFGMRVRKAMLEQAA